MFERLDDVGEETGTSELRAGNPDNTLGLRPPAPICTMLLLETKLFDLQ